MAETVRIDPAAHAALRGLADQLGVSLQEAVSRAVAAYQRQLFFEGLAEEFKALRQNPEAVAEEEEELKTWDQALGDGLDEEPD